MPDDAGAPAGKDERENLQDMAERATLLYWNSDRSVNSIAEDLGLSKGRLYDLIRPLSSGRPCPNCQSELVFPNRTARDKDDPLCPVCDEGLGQVPVSVRRQGSAETRGSAPGISEERAPEAATGRNEAERVAPESTGRRGSPSASPDTGGVLAGFLIGAVAGVILGRFLKR